MHEEREMQIVPDRVGCDVQIGEMDGSMIPIVTTNEKDKRKKLSWKEVRLSMVHEKGSTNPKFGFQGDVDDAGQCLLDSAILAGFGTQTHVHAVGAPWIAEQVSSTFGSQGCYLVVSCM